MRKSILFLINGYGVEQNDSIAIYSKELITKGIKYFFTI